MPSSTVTSVLAYTQQPGRYGYLVRLWGRDCPAMCMHYDLHPNEGEDDSTVAVWF